MEMIWKCPVCDSNDVLFEQTYMAQFVVWRASGNFINCHPPCPAIKCKHCTFAGSALRFNDKEMANLYDDYRGTSYNSLRVHCEPSYIELVGKFNTPEEIAKRNFGITSLIEKNIDAAAIKSVLDFGGGTGQFIPPILSHTEKYVYDISGVPLLEGVKRFKGQEDRSFDFIMSCHVLEHLPEPKSVMKEIMRFAQVASYFYFEVPDFDAPPIPNGVWHEHINSFNEKSLSTLLINCNHELIDFVRFNNSIGYLTKKIDE